ncbi:hypothetical protein BGW37DRAFT_540779 [Umbelopsis sp. PMI_123]|nr:hypothetical protein BGW37DRAFT_540779 [Umbelopsis sp. PMI_123]
MVVNNMLVDSLCSSLNTLSLGKSFASRNNKNKERRLAENRLQEAVEEQGRQRFVINEGMEAEDPDNVRTMPERSVPNLPMLDCREDELGLPGVPTLTLCHNPVHHATRQSIVAPGQSYVLFIQSQATSFSRKQLAKISNTSQGSVYSSGCTANVSTSLTRPLPSMGWRFISLTAGLLASILPSIRAPQSPSDYINVFYEIFDFQPLRIRSLDELRLKNHKSAFARRILTDGHAVNFLFARKRGGKDSIDHVQLGFEDFTDAEIATYFEVAAIDPGRTNRYLLLLTALVKKDIK